MAAWLLDLLTPQLFVVAILLNGPIALSSLTLDTRFTQLLVVLALVANVSAGYANGVADGYHWAGVAIGDRVISGLSFLLVGGLSIATQRSAREAGELAAREYRTTRERVVRHAVEVIRRSMNVELIERAIAREACSALEVERSRLYSFAPALDRPTTYSSALGSEDVEISVARPPAAILSLLQRVAEEREIVEIRETDALGRLLLATFEAPYAIAAPLVEHESFFGVLVLTRGDAPFAPRFQESLRYYVDQAGIALAQASLFRELGARNEELGTANAALQERTDVIRDIVYALSHDLRTPLAAARLTIQQALEGAYGSLPDGYRAILERTLQSNDELQRLAETLLLVSRYESGERSTRREPLDLVALARGVVDELEPLWRSKKIEARVEPASEAFVSADAGEMRRALVNLVANAVNFTPAGGSVTVRVATSGDRTSLSVADTGFGVPESERARLFERLGAGSGRPGAGSGLGLYIVRRIAESHDGSVAYEPRPEGGSIFTLRLPALAAGVPA